MRRKPLHRDESGVTLLEGLIVFPLMLTVIVTFIEFGYGVFQWEQTGRAVALGARLAAVSNPIATDFDTLASDYNSNTSTLISGDPVPSTVLRAICSGGNLKGAMTLCNAGLDRIIKGTDGKCDANIGNSMAGMCDLNATIKAANVVVTYTRDGLGFVGRSNGPVATVTVQLRDMNFATFFLGSLFGINNIPMRPNPVSFTAEDLATCNNPVRTATSFTSHCP